MDSQIDLGQDRGDIANDLGDLVGKVPAVGIAKHQTFGSGIRGCSQDLDSENGIGPVAVEKVLGVKKDASVVSFQILD
jgi:hypothetical protein